MDEAAVQAALLSWRRFIQRESERTTKMDAIVLIKRHEKLSVVPYKDKFGNLTIGWGRNLSCKGISMDEANILLDNDIGEVLANARECAWYLDLNTQRQAVILDMAFNLGWAGLLKFTRFLEAVEAKLFAVAAAEMLNSGWAHQVGDRALEDAQIMDTGKWPDER